MTESGRKLALEAETWIGTPFFPHACAKAIGVDCVQLGRGVVAAAGLATLESIVFPKYRLDSGPHLDSSLVIQWLENSPLFRKVEVPSPGCVITLKVGRVEHHVGIVLMDCRRFIHSLRSYGVIVGQLADKTWSKRLRSIWEPV